MPHVIIGHTTSDGVRVWVKGDATSTQCAVTLRPAPPKQPASVRLSHDTDFTAAIPIGDLEASTEYTVRAHFMPSNVSVRGRVRTFASSVDSPAGSFSFVLSSCNLSIVAVNDFLATLASTAGAGLAVSSMDIPPYRWRWPRWRWAQWVFRGIATLSLYGVAAFVRSATGLKQSGQAYLRSPFLKLSAVFESTVIELSLPAPPVRDANEDKEDYARRHAQFLQRKRQLFLAIGDRIESAHGATAVIASMDDDDIRLIRRLVLTQVEGTFTESAVLFRRVSTGRTESLRRLGPIVAKRDGANWYDKPSFFLHAGDQIYYDFPVPERPPNRDEYRLAYQEAWFEDASLKHLLAHWPHYMTLDDHEIADQFAQDFIPPNEHWPGEYLRAASTAYREYAHALNPERPAHATNHGPFWFTFEKGATHFFVMDTRTQRFNAKKEIIDPEQLSAFLVWLCEHRNQLKFVVTSVPFVAELSLKAADGARDWFGRQPNSEHDKWSAPEFIEQRQTIIEHIATKQIEHLVFLTGDMHCCYHATMRVGQGTTRYESCVVHELAGGPVNQLQLARVTDFVPQRKARTEGERPVDYEVTLERFHADVSAVMHVKVNHVRRHDVLSGSTRVPEVEWNVIRTLTDPGPSAWLDTPDERKSGIKTREPVMSGRISFAKHRRPEELRPWV